MNSKFSHVSHVGYDAKQGFSAQNIPQEWKLIFAKAGITEDQLKDKKTAKFVAKFMKQHGGDAPSAVPASRVAPTSAPSQQSSRPPPPPVISFNFSLPLLLPLLEDSLHPRLLEMYTSLK
jgi:hypothetical protein